MSRTIKGSKSPGYEYWSKRMYLAGPSKDKYDKKRTHRKERRDNKKLEIVDNT